MMLSDVCLSLWHLSVAYIAPKSRTERPRMNTTFKVKRSKVKVTRPLCSAPCWPARRLQRWSWERVGRGKVLLRCGVLGGTKRFSAHGGGEERGHIVAAAHLQLVYVCIFTQAGIVITPFDGIWRVMTQMTGNYARVCVPLWIRLLRCF